MSIVSKAIEEAHGFREKQKMVTLVAVETDLAQF